MNRGNGFNLSGGAEAPREDDTRSREVDGIAGWLQVDDDALAVVTHIPDGQPRGIMVIATSVGREGVVAYRSLRVLALTAVAAGLLVYRFAWRGTGDSGGELPDDVAAAWSRDLTAVIQHARQTAPGRPVTVVGLRLGAAIAFSCRTVLDDGDLTIGWEPVAGRRWLREHVALRKLWVSQAPDSTGVEVGGALFSQAGANSLSNLRLPKSPTPGWVEMRGENRESAERLYAVPSRDALVEYQAINRVVELAVATCATAPGAGESVSVDLPEEWMHVVDGSRVREHFVRVGPEHLPAVLTEPAEKTQINNAMVLVPADAEPRDGPTGLWARTARRLASRGASVLRVDRRDMGEATQMGRAEQPIPYREEILQDVAAAVCDQRARTGMEVTGVGLCSGAWLLLRDAARLPLKKVIAINNVAWSPRPDYYDRYYKTGRLKALLGADATSEPVAPFTKAPTSWKLRLKLFLKAARNEAQMRMPHAARRQLSRYGVMQTVSQLFEKGTPEVLLAMGSEDLIEFKRSGGVQEVQRLRKAGHKIQVSPLGDVDHALLSFAGRSSVEQMLLREIRA